jgi:hypothetical protein
MSETSDGSVLVGRRACARPAGCCAGGPPEDWCEALRASLAAAPDGLPRLPSPLPRLGARVQTDQGPGRVARITAARQIVGVTLEGSAETVELPVAGLTQL